MSDAIKKRSLKRFLPLTLTFLILAIIAGLLYWMDGAEARVSHALNYTIESVQCSSEDSNCTGLHMTVTNTADTTVFLDYNDTGGGPNGGKNNIKIYGDDNKNCEGRPSWIKHSKNRRSPESLYSVDDEILGKTTYQAYLGCEFYVNSATERPRIYNPSYVTIYGKRYDVR